MISLFSRISLIIFIIRYITLHKNLIYVHNHAIVKKSHKPSWYANTYMPLPYYPHLSEAKLVKRIAEMT